MLKPTKPRFSLEDAERANDEWGANCGPGALAAIMGMTLDEVRQHMVDFESKHYTSPSLMNAALRSIGHPWKKIGAVLPNYGLVRVQWQGPWTNPGVPMRARYRHTHWIGAVTLDDMIGIFDINCMKNGSGWVTLENWEYVVVPYLTGQNPRANGKWHITHAIEIERPLPKVTRTVLSFPGDPDLELTY